jgi:hypothetical protein
MGNSGDERFIPILQQLSKDADANVAEHARWAADHLREMVANRDNK